MFEKPDALNTLGLEIEGDFLKGADLCLQKGKLVLKQFFSFGLEKTDGSVKPLYIDAPSDFLKKAVQNKLVVTALNTHEVLVRQLEIKLKKEKDFDAVLNFSAEPLLPYPIENGIVDRVIIGPSAEGTQLSVFAARKDHIQHHLDVWHALQVEPEVVSAVPQAIAAFAAYFHPSENPLLAVHLGQTYTTCLLMDKKKLIAALFCPQGVFQLKQAFEHDLEAAGPLFERLDFSLIDSAVSPALAKAKEQWRTDLTRTIYALFKSLKGNDAKEILVTGEGALLPGLPSFLLANATRNISVPSPIGSFQASVEDLQKYAVSIGAALTALPKGSDQINFRQQDFAYPDPWKRYKKPLAIYGTLCLSIAFAVYLFGSSYAAHLEDQVKSDYSALLVSMNKPYESFEKEALKKYPLKTSLEEGRIPPLQDLSINDLSDRLGLLQKENQAIPDSFPLMPNTPRVSDVLAWLSQHKAIIGSQDADHNAIQIESFAYTMVKRPEQTKRQEKYQVKVELEFISPTPKQAREFHDALIAPNPFIDPKGEVKWSTNRGKYRTSFYLKDKTVYSGGQSS